MKRQRMAEWIKKTRSGIYAVYKKSTSDLGTQIDSK